MTDPNHDEAELTRIWTPDPHTPRVPPGDPFGVYAGKTDELASAFRGFTQVAGASSTRFPSANVPHDAVFVRNNRM